eukprot:gene12741-biopygen4963
MQSKRSPVYTRARAHAQDVTRCVPTRSMGGPAQRARGIRPDIHPARCDTSEWKGGRERRTMLFPVFIAKPYTSPAGRTGRTRPAGAGGAGLAGPAHTVEASAPGLL